MFLLWRFRERESGGILPLSGDKYQQDLVVHDNMKQHGLCYSLLWNFCFIPEDKWGSFILSDHIGNFNIVKIEWDCKCWTIYTCSICKLITIWLWNDHRLLLHLHHFSLCCSDYQNMDTGILDFSTQFRLNLSFKIHVIYIWHYRFLLLIFLEY